MALCKYCGQPAGLLRKMHTQCHERHERAVSLVPVFFSKFLESNLSVDRFQQLLQSAAEASYVKPDEMRTFAVAGITQAVKSILEQRLLETSEATRIQELVDALQPHLSNVAPADDLLVKIDVLRDLQNGKVPDRVTVAGPMPVELPPAETVIWIFNDVTAYRVDDIATAREPGTELALDKVAYYGLKAFSAVQVPRDKLHKDSRGDMVVTNRNLHFLISDVKSRRLPIARTTALRAYADGLYVASEPTSDKSRIFVLNDAWFAANLILRLFQRFRR
jgi:hypothetical protein